MRIALLDLVKDLSVETLNTVPDGFNNNIIWNMCHLVSAQQGICYVRAGVDPVVSEQYILPYRPGTKPTHTIVESEIEVIKGLMLSTIQQLQDDYDREIFSNYTTWSTRYGVELKNIDEAIEFLAFHEGLHFGYVMAMKRVLPE